MKKPDKKALIEVLTFIHDFCAEPKEDYCNNCIFYGDLGCSVSAYPEYWEVDEIAELLYEKEV